jgi:hypothetical protein
MHTTKTTQDTSPLPRVIQPPLKVSSVSSAALVLSLLKLIHFRIGLNFKVPPFFIRLIHSGKMSDGLDALLSASRIDTDEQRHTPIPPQAEICQ